MWKEYLKLSLYIYGRIAFNFEHIYYISYIVPIEKSAVERLDYINFQRVEVNN